MNGLMNEWIDEWMDWWMNGLMNEWIDEWMDWWMNGLMNEWIGACFQGLSTGWKCTDLSQVATIVLRTLKAGAARAVSS